MWTYISFIIRKKVNIYLLKTWVSHVTVPTGHLPHRREAQVLFLIFSSFFGATGVWIQGFQFARQVLYQLRHTLSPFCFSFYILIGIHPFLLWLASDYYPSTSTSHSWDYRHVSPHLVLIHVLIARGREREREYCKFLWSCVHFTHYLSISHETTKLGSGDPEMSNNRQAGSLPGGGVHVGLKPVSLETVEIRRMGWGPQKPRKVGKNGVTFSWTRYGFQARRERGRTRGKGVGRQLESGRRGATVRQIQGHVLGLSPKIIFGP
jgi:hypothetical protein